MGGWAGEEWREDTEKVVTGRERGKEGDREIERERERALAS